MRALKLLVSFLVASICLGSLPLLALIFTLGAGFMLLHWVAEIFYQRIFEDDFERAQREKAEWQKS